MAKTTAYEVHNALYIECKETLSKASTFDSNDCQNFLMDLAPFYKS